MAAILGTSVSRSLESPTALLVLVFFFLSRGLTQVFLKLLITLVLPLKDWDYPHVSSPYVGTLSKHAHRWSPLSGL